MKIERLKLPPLAWRYDSPSDVRCWYELAIARVTSSRGGHGSPLNSISTE